MAKKSKKKKKFIKKIAKSPRKDRQLNPAKNTARVAKEVALHAKGIASAHGTAVTSGEIQHDFHTALRKSEKRTSPSSFPIVGIGSSAGGIEAASTLFEMLPPDLGMAFVVIQHLDPARPSYLTEILGRCTKMPVISADHLMAVKPNCIYVIPPDRSLGIVNSKLRLMPRIEPKPTHMAIDFFFRCLAEDQREKAIGLILSGGDSDGTLGMAEIKKHGGVTFVQDPSTAKVPSMPQNAIRSGVDFILPVNGIAQELIQLAATLSKAKLSLDGENSADEAALARIFLRLKTQVNVDFSQYKRPTLIRRIRRRMVLRKLTSVTDYALYVEGHPGEVQSLFDDLLINVTNFFRDVDVFETLRHKAFPRLLKGRSPNQSVRIWVPGCSAGEEVYSLAITLLETFQELGVHFPVQIFGTDISETSLNTARAGIYPEAIKTDVSPERLRRFFVRVDGQYRVIQSIRDMCIFASHDVTQDPPFSRMDFISCRNLLIYLGPALQKRVMQVFGYALNPKGYLLLGTSEAASHSSDIFGLLDKKHKIYLRRPQIGRDKLNLAGLPAILRQRGDTSTAPALVTGKSNATLEMEVQRLIAQKYRPSCVVVSEDLQIVQFFGDTSPFLEHATGTANLNILRMARGELQIELRQLLKPRKGGALMLAARDLTVGGPNHKFKIDIEVYRLELPQLGSFKVIFFDRHSSSDKRPQKNSTVKTSERQTVTGLREELVHANDSLAHSLQDLELTNEELQSANEEILSSNEELQSMNEELETAKEELQSSNEELTTVNEELTTRNGQLTLMNDDLQNLLASVHMPIVMVGSDLRIRRFTPTSERLLNLIPADIGRPITDVRPNFNLPELGDLIADTIDSMVIKELQVHSQNGQPYLLRIRPYRTVENKIDGAVLVFVDITSPLPPITKNKKHK